MNFVDIELTAQARIDELGVAQDKAGLADEPITMSNYKAQLAEYQRLLNDAFVLIRELARDLAPIQVGEHHD